MSLQQQEIKNLLDMRAPARMPPPASLSEELNKLLDLKRSTLPAESAPLFLSSAVEMWHRSIHSFIESVALTKSSSLWASVVGYYASHYVVRAFAHLHGYYSLFRKGRIVELTYSTGRFNMQLHGYVREHDYYWGVVGKILQEPEFGEN